MESLHRIIKYTCKNTLLYGHLICVRICATRLKVALFVVTFINGLICNEKQVFLIFPVTFQPKAALDDIIKMFGNSLSFSYQLYSFYLILLCLNRTLNDL